MNCPFCDINLEKSRIIKEKNFVRVILSYPCLMPGHLLVVPRRHVERAVELNNKERKELFETIIEFQEKILNKIASGCDIREHYRPFQKESRLKVSHLHFHLQPRELFDELYKKCQIFETDVFRDPSLEELNKMARTLGK